MTEHHEQQLLMLELVLSCWQLVGLTTSKEKSTLANCLAASEADYQMEDETALPWDN